MIKLMLPLRYKSGKQNILYSLNNFMIPIGTDAKVNTYWLKRAKDSLITKVKKQLKGLEPFKDQVDLTLTIYRDSNRLCDMGNFSILEKFTTDAVVKAGVLADDNWKYIRSVSIIDGGLCKENPRAEYVLQETE